MLRKNNFENAAAMRLWSNKLRQAFGVSACLPTDKVLESWQVADFLKDQDFNPVTGNVRQGTLYLSEPHLKALKLGKTSQGVGFSANDADRLKDYLVAEFRKAKVLGVDIEISIPIYNSLHVEKSDCANELADVMRLAITVPSFDIHPSPYPEEIMNKIIISLERPAMALRIERVRQEVEHMRKLFSCE